METPEKIPLQEAVSRGLIPCAACGGNGASPESLGGKRHFVCPPCARRLRRRVLLIAALLGVAVVVGLFLIFNRKPDPAEKARAEVQKFLNEVDPLIRDRKFREARARLAAAPPLPEVVARLGYCHHRLGYYETGLPLWQLMTGHPSTEEDGRVNLGRAYVLLGHSSTGLPFLEKAAVDPGLDRDRRQVLAECYLDLERFEDALKTLDGGQGIRDPRLRFRILLSLGREDDARKLLAELGAEAEKDPAAAVLRTQLAALQQREGGDFEGARRTLDEALAKAGDREADAAYLRRSALGLSLESGDLKRLHADAEALLKRKSLQWLTDAQWYRMLAHLEVGNRDDAVVAAKDGLERSDPELASYRHKLWTFQHLLGQRKDEDLEAELKRVHRFIGNEIAYYLALSTGKKEWAEKALQMTVGHDFPYYAIRRRLGK